MPPVENIQPAQTSQMGVARHQYTVPQQAELDKQHLEEAAKKKEAEKREQTQEAKKSDEAIIRDKEKRQGNKKKKKKNPNKLVVIKEKHATGTDPGEHLLDIKI